MLGFIGFKTHAQSPGVDPPAITLQPQNQMLIRGSNATFSVMATGGELSFQWYCNGAAAVPFGTNAVLILTNAQPSQEGAYSVTITNFSGSVTSDSVSLTVLCVLTNGINPYTPGTFGYDLFVATYALTGATNSSASYIPNAAMLGTNQSVWTWPINLSCVGYASDGYESLLLAPDKLLSCAHFGGEAGQTVLFHDTNGVPWMAAVSNTVGAIADMVIAQLSNVAPSSIVIPYVLPPDYTNYIEGHTLVGMPAFWLHKNPGHVDYAWVVYLDDYDWYGYGTWMGLVHSSDWPSGTAATGGDSSSPAFLSWSNNPVLAFATTLTPDAWGLFVSGLTNWNSLAELGLTNGMKILDMSGYAPQPPVLRDPGFGYDYLVPPANQTAPSGSNVTYSVSLRVLGASPFNYQWQFDGTNLPGATSSSLTVRASEVSVGNYSVFVSNDLGSVIVGPAFLQLPMGSSLPTDSPLPPWTFPIIGFGICVLGANVLRSAVKG